MEPAIEECVFRTNQATSAGGGLFVINTLPGTVVNSVFSGNAAANAGGGSTPTAGSDILGNDRVDIIIVGPASRTWARTSTILRGRPDPGPGRSPFFQYDIAALLPELAASSLLLSKSVSGAAASSSLYTDKSARLTDADSH